MIQSCGRNWRFTLCLIASCILEKYQSSIVGSFSARQWWSVCIVWIVHATHYEISLCKGCWNGCFSITRWLNSISCQKGTSRLYTLIAWADSNPVECSDEGLTSIPCINGMSQHHVKWCYLLTIMQQIDKHLEKTMKLCAFVVPNPFLLLLLWMFICNFLVSFFILGGLRRYSRFIGLE